VSVCECVCVNLQFSFHIQSTSLGATDFARRRLGYGTRLQQRDFIHFHTVEFPWNVLEDEIRHVSKLVERLVIVADLCHDVNAFYHTEIRGDGGGTVYSDATRPDALRQHVFYDQLDVLRIYIVPTDDDDVFAAPTDIEGLHHGFYDGLLSTL
jgi:hypothetical protein